MFTQYVKQIPIRMIDATQSQEKARHDRVVERVDKMLSLKERLAQANTNHQKTIIQRQIGTTGRQIDQLVYELYGLTDAEIEIVEEATGR